MNENMDFHRQAWSVWLTRSCTSKSSVFLMASTTALAAILLSLSLSVICLFGYLAIAFLAFDQPTADTVSVTDGPIVHTSSGKIEGVFQQTLGQQISAFYGVPFATPPVGSLRFSRPEPLVKWRGTFKADSMPPACMQYNSETIDLPIFRIDENQRVPESEDCLKLNIWTPGTTGNKSRPVLIWIHGGGFITGHIRRPEFDGSILSSFTDSVVAMMNYRVGVFGFLNLGDDDISGNMGMHDQVLAIAWIKRNARSFGGDPDSVTLFGGSAGAASVGFHLLSPLSQNLFKRAILESGSPLMPVSLVTDRQMEKTANDVLSSCGCSKADIQKPADCLRSASLQVLLEAQSKIIRRKDDTTFSPSFWDDFLPKNPIDSMRDGDFGTDKDLMLGFNKDEGSVFMYFANPQKYPAVGSKSTPKFNVSLQEVLEFATNFLKSQNPIATKNLINSLYTDMSQGSIFNSTRMHVGEFCVVCPMIFAAEDFAQRNISVYFYHFTHRPKNTPWAEWLGATHFEEVQFVFGLPLAHPQSYTRDEVKLSKRVMNAWASFARTGKPDLSSHTQWPKYTTSDQTYVELKTRSARIKSRIPQQKCNLWKLMFEVSHSEAASSSSLRSASEAGGDEETEESGESDIPNANDYSDDKSGEEDD